MSYIPDCRTDEVYNYHNLRQRDRDFTDGFDYCAEQAVPNAFDNLDCWNPDLDVKPSDVRKVIEAFKPFMLEWIEQSRNEMITSALDNADDEREEEKAADS